MPSIAQGRRFSNTSTSNLVVAGVVLLLVVGLFFVPEVVRREPELPVDYSGLPEAESSFDDAVRELFPKRLARSAPSSAPKPAPPKRVEPEPGRAVRLQKLEGDLSPLEQIALRLEELSRPAVEETTEADATQDLDVEEEKPKKKKRRAADDPLIPPDAPLNWKLLHSGPVKKAFRQAKRQAVKLVADVDDQFKFTRFALQNYIGGMTRVMAGKGLLAEEVPDYVSRLDSAVTDSMLQERVPEVYRMEWAAISLGPELQTSWDLQRKQALVAPFNPKLHIAHVRVRQGYKHRGKWDPDARVAVKVNGYVVGKHVKKIELYRNGRRIRRLPLEKRADDQGRRIFRMRQGHEVRNAVYTFRVFDLKDRVYEKSYTFYPRVTAFHWNGRTDGTFAIPFSHGDPRIDQFFFVSARRPGVAQTAQRNFATF